MYEGYNNEVTYHWACIAENDAKISKYIDNYILGGNVAPTYDVLLSQVRKTDLPDHLQSLYKQVDLLQVYMRRAYELYSDGRLSDTKFEKMLRHFNGGTSTYAPHYQGPRPIRHIQGVGLTLDADPPSAGHDDFTDAIAYALESLPSIPKEQDTMKQIKIETITYLNGKNIADLTVDEKVSMLAETEARVDKLKQVKAKSVMITKEIERLKTDLAAMVALFDKDIEISKE